MAFPQLRIGAACVAVPLLPAVTHAAEIAHEPFDYTAGNPVSGGSGGSGWFDAWIQDGEACVIRAEDMGCTDEIGNILDTGGLLLDTANTATTRSFRGVDGPPRSGVWISFLYHLPGSNSLFEGISFYQGNAEVFAVSNPSTDAGPAIALGNRAAGGEVDTGRGEFGVTHFIVLEVGDGTGADGMDQVRLFVDPLLAGTPSMPDGVIHAPDFAFDTLRVAGQDGAPLFIDELRIGDTFADVTPHDPAGDEDSDGDGLTDAQEIVLGLDPSISDEDLILAIQQNPEFFDLHDEAGILALDDGGVVIPKEDGSPVDFRFEVQESGNLADWSLLQSFDRSVELPGGKNFLRVTLSDD